jgi:hypothetical protein
MKEKLKLIFYHAFHSESVNSMDSLDSLLFLNDLIYIYILYSMKNIPLTLKNTQSKNNMNIFRV